MNRYKVAVYVRVSTEEQALEGYSIAAQKQRLTMYCESQDWDISGFYVDEGISAKDMNRPELQRMLRHVEEGIIDCILVYRLDRLTRSVLDLYKILEVLDKNNCKFKSATEVYDTTSAIGRLFITLVAALAQWERENMGERIRMGQQEKVRQGRYTSNRRPYGYDLEPTSGVLTIREEEAQVVRQIFELYNKGYSAPKLAKLLNSQQTPGRNVWNEKAVMYTLTNPLYIGTLRWNKDSEQYFEVADAVPAIIDEKLFHDTQRVIESRKNMHPRQIAFDYIFSGALKCSKCGGVMVGHYTTYKKRSGETRKYKQYKCKSSKIGMCEGFHASERALEIAFLEYLNNLQLPVIEESAAAIQQETDTAQNDVQNEIAKIQTELAEIERRRKKWQYAWVNDMLSDEDFSQRMKEENEKERMLRDRLLDLNPVEGGSLDAEVMLEMLQDLRRNWERMTDYEKKSLVQIILKKLVVIRSEDKPKDVHIKEMEFN